jgi:hypothetical protein
LAVYCQHVTATIQTTFNPTIFKEYATTLPEHEQHLLHHLEFTPEGEATLKEFLKVASHTPIFTSKIARALWPFIMTKRDEIGHFVSPH